MSNGYTIVSFNWWLLSRSKEIADIETIAQGRVWIGEDALKLGLVDEFGGIEKSIRHAAKLANLKKEFDAVEVTPSGKPFRCLHRGIAGFFYAGRFFLDR